jgi:hypothetical protein
MPVITWKNIGSQLPVNYSSAAGQFTTRGFDQFANLANQAREANIAGHQLQGKQLSDNALLQLHGLSDPDSYQQDAQNILNPLTNNENVDMAALLGAKQDRNQFLTELRGSQLGNEQLTLQNKFLPTKQEADLAATRAGTSASYSQIANNKLLQDINRNKLTQAQLAQKNAEDARNIATQAVTRNVDGSYAYDPNVFINALDQGVDPASLQTVRNLYGDITGLDAKQSSTALEAEREHQKELEVLKKSGKFNSDKQLTYEDFQSMFSSPVPWMGNEPQAYRAYKANIGRVPTKTLNTFMANNARKENGDFDYRELEKDIATWLFKNPKWKPEPEYTQESSFDASIPEDFKNPFLIPNKK